VWGTEAALEPAHPGQTRGIERWLLQATNVDQEAEALAAGLLQLRREGTSLRDIAVLARTNKDAGRLGAACRARGVPALLELPGLLATREGALVLAGLRLVADRYDSLAAATILHLLDDAGEQTPGLLAERLEALRTRERARAAATEEQRSPEPPPFAGNPRLAPLEGIDRRTLPPAVLIRRIIDALGVGDRLRGWGDVAARAASLDGLVALAQTYEDEARGLGRTATLTGLITHLEGLAADETDQATPPYGIDAVTIVTYHSSKGLEWETVVLGGLDSVPKPRLWDADVRGGDPAGEDPLAGRGLRYWPWPFGAGGRSRNLPPQTNLDQIALSSTEGAAAVEAAAGEEERLLYVGCTRARRRLVFAHRPDKAAWLAVLPDIDTLLPPTADPGEHPVPGVRTTYVVRHLTPEMAAELAELPPVESTWLTSLQPAGETPEFLPRYYSPSLAPSEGTSATVVVEQLPAEPVFPEKLNQASDTALGNAVHAYLTALPSLAGMGPEERNRVAERCLLGFGAGALISADQLVDMGERLREWVAAKLPGAVWHTEVPVAAPRTGGGQWNGSIDLLLRLPDGSVVVVDHKSSPIRRELCSTKAATYAGQLAAYRDALAAQDLPVTAAWIHFPLAAAVASVQVA
jgi:ATP-dependent exoDNAse (exonuclease V) beta subunit